MLKDSFKHRKKYYFTLFASIYVIIFLICALVIAANWKYIKILFTPKQEEVSLEKKQFDELFAKVQHLEDLSKEYNEQDYQLRMVIYIRAAQYSDSDWGYLLGCDDQDFVNYVQDNQGDKNITDLRNLGLNYCFTNPNTKQKVDFYKLFANLNAIMLQNQDIIDCVSWGSFVSKNAYLYKNSSLSYLKDDIKLNMQTGWINGDYIRFADYDAVGIYDNFINNYYSFESVYVSCIKYYATFDKTEQLENFKSEMNFKIDENQDFSVEELENQIYLRMQNNIYLQKYCDSLNFNFPDIDENEEASQQAKVYKAAIRAYAEIILGV